MKKQLFLLMPLMAGFCIAACGGNGNKDVSTSTNESDVMDSASTKEELVEEVFQPIGDRAYYQVHGNVKTITFVKGCKEFKRKFYPLEGIDVDAKVKQKVQAFIKECSITNSVTFDESGKGISSKKDFFTSRKEDGMTSFFPIFCGDDPVYGGNYELSCEYGIEFKYDLNGRLIQLGGYACVAPLEYDQNNRVVKESGSSEGSYSSDIVYTYDEDGNCVKKETVETEEDPMTGEVIGEPQTSVTIYTILEKDNQGNWTKRKSSEGVIDERTITYY